RTSRLQMLASGSRPQDAGRTACGAFRARGISRTPRRRADTHAAHGAGRGCRGPRDARGTDRAGARLAAGEAQQLMRIGGCPVQHLTYCTNIHSAESWAETRDALARHLPAIKAAVSPNAPMGVGLRLSAASAEELAMPNAFGSLQA